MRFVAAVLVALVLAVPSQVAQAGGTATDGAVSLGYPSNHWNTAGGPTNFLGTLAIPSDDVVFDSSWWYRRTTGDTREHPFPPPDTETYAGGIIRAHWNDVDGQGFSADETTWVFDNEGPSGAYVSELHIVALAGPIDLTFFHYLDLAAGGTFGGDTGLQLAYNAMKFTDGTHAVRYRASTYTSGYEVAAFTSGSPLLNKLDDANVDTLSNSGLPFPAGDPVAAYQFPAPLPDTGWSTKFSVSVSSDLPHDFTKCELWLDGSGFPGLVFQNGTTLEHWSMRRGTRAFGYGGSVPAHQRVVGCDDFVYDSASELVTHDQVTGQLFIRGEAVTGASPLPLAWQVAATGRLNVDTHPDVLWRNTATQKLKVWLMNGLAKIGETAPTPDQAVDGNWEVVGLADFDADGHNDFLWYNQTSGKLVIWYMSASLVRLTGAFTNPSTVGNNNWKALAVGDYGRGPGGLHDTPDIVWQNDTSRRVVVWYMDHAGNRTSGAFTTPDSVPVDTLNWILSGPR